MTASPFAAAAPDLIALGYSPIPLIAPDWMTHAGRGKCPGDYRGGAWSGLGGWQKYRDQRIEGFDLRRAMAAPGANVGVVLGSATGRRGADGEPLFVLAVDVDVADPDAVDEIVRALPTSPMAKRGAKGVTLFYAAPKAIKSRSFDDERIPRDAGIPRRLVDLLTGFDARQAALPPSVHPDTGQPYTWTAGPVAAGDLPEFTADDLEKLAEALEGFGYDPTAARGGRGERQPRVPRAPSEPGDVFDEVKAAALENLPAWVPALDQLHALRPARGGYEAVSLLRGSSTGRPLEERRRNLSINPAGIQDFGTGETFSAIDLVVACQGLSVSEAVSWLEARLFPDLDEILIDLKPTAAPKSKTPPVAAWEGRATEGESREGHAGGDGPAAADGHSTGSVATHEVAGPAELPQHLLEVPGLVGDIAAWMNRTAQRPLPALNLMAAIALVGTAAGRKFSGPTEAGTVTYALGLAPTGAGKAHVIRAAQHLLGVSGLSHMLAASSWMSGSALVQAVSRHPVSLTLSDEVGEFLARLNSAKASTHERAISGVMRELYGINWGSFVAPGWASSVSRTAIAPIHAPAYSFVGLGVPDALWSALQGADISNGFLNRFLLFATAAAGEEQEPEESVFDVSPALVDRFRAIALVGGPLVTASMHGDQPAQPLVRVPWVDGRDGLARCLFNELRAYCREHPDGEKLMKRTAEQAIRLATIRAIGIGGEKAAVTLEDMNWGREVALWSAERMIADAAAYMAETEHQSRALHILRIIKTAPGATLTRTAIYRSVNHKYRARELDEILQGLVEAGQVVGNSDRTGRRGAPSTSYQAV